MSDDEDYEYEYNDDSDEEMQDAEDSNDDYDDDDQSDFVYTDEDEDVDEVDADVENAYYNAKGLKESSNLDVNEAASAFEEVIEMEKKEGSSHGPWSFKAMKQLVKLYLRVSQGPEMMEAYKRLLECIAASQNASITQNAIEKGVNSIVERVSSAYNSHTSEKSLPKEFYTTTLRAFHPKDGIYPNERLWFKTNLKLGQLLYELNDTVELQQVIKDLMQMNSSSASNSSANIGMSSSQTHLMEIYALQVQLYSRLKDNKKLRQVFEKAMRVEGSIIPHPRTLALIQELGGKMHMASREFRAAGKTFFQAFKSYDEAGDPARLRCLKYLVMASMLHASSINPFDSQEARPYKDDPEIVAMTNLVQAFHSNEIKAFEGILRRNEGKIMDDDFVREHLADLLRTIRTQVLLSLIAPYKRINLSFIAKELNDIPLEDVESLLVSLILDGKLDGKIDQQKGILVKSVAIAPSSTTPTSVLQSSSVLSMEALGSRNCAAVEQLSNALESLNIAIANNVGKKSSFHQIM